MNAPVPCLAKLPNKDEFFEKYWNKSAFVVKDGVSNDVMKQLIKPGELLWLSLKEEARSRIVKKGNTLSEMVVDYGPFKEEVFESLGGTDWSLLIQNVETFHVPTKKIIEPFYFSPCWLIEDVMVSYSTIGGGIGPHYDPYHVFLVQGQGKRSWKIGKTAIKNEKILENMEFEVLANDFDGDEFVVESGDVIYIPPMFAHKGETLEESVTYSVGFLGPLLSELFFAYGRYIEKNDDLDKRFFGNELTANSSGKNITKNDIVHFKDKLINSLQSEHFNDWIKSNFKNSKYF